MSIDALTRWHELVALYPMLQHIEEHVRGCRLPETSPQYHPTEIAWQQWLRSVVPYGADRELAHDYLLRLYQRSAVEAGP